MDYRTIGESDIAVSVLGFGGAAVSGEGKGYGFGAISEEESITLLRRVYENGITLFDTAPIYGYGTSEIRIGKAFKHNRDKVIIVSKGGLTWDDRKRINTDNSPKVMTEMIDSSLSSLGCDRIDIYFVHWPDPRTDIRKTMETLVKARENGKIGLIGLSNSNEKEIQKAEEIAHVDILQSQFSLLARDPVSELFPIARDLKIGFMSWGTLDRGILTGRVDEKRTFDPFDLRHSMPWWTKVDKSHRYAAYRKLMEIVEPHGLNGLELSIGYVLGFPELTTALCGFRNVEQLESGIAALDHRPSQELIDEVVDEIARIETENER